MNDLDLDIYNGSRSNVNMPIERQCLTSYLMVITIIIFRYLSWFPICLLSKCEWPSSLSLESSKLTNKYDIRSALYYFLFNGNSHLCNVYDSLRYKRVWTSEILPISIFDLQTEGEGYVKRLNVANLQRHAFQRCIALESVS